MDGGRRKLRRLYATQFMESTTQVLKTDVSGRVWTPRAQRDAILDEFEKSGMPALKFAAVVGVKYPTLANWIQKRRQAREASSDSGESAPIAAEPAALKWFEATVESRPTLEVQLPGGAMIKVSNASQAVLAGHLLRALSAGGAPC